MRVSVMRTPATLSSAMSRSDSSMQPRRQGRRAAKRWQYVADLVLDELLWITELDQMGHVAVPQRVQVQLRRQVGGPARRLEGVVRPSQGHSGAPLGDPERRVLARHESGADLADVLVENADDPVHFRDGQNAAALGRSALGRLAVTDEDRSEPAVVGDLGIPARVTQVQAARCRAVRSALRRDHVPGWSTSQVARRAGARGRRAMFGRSPLGGGRLRG